MVFGCTLNKHPWSFDIRSWRIHPVVYPRQKIGTSPLDNACLYDQYSQHTFSIFRFAFLTMMTLARTILVHISIATYIFIFYYAFWLGRHWLANSCTWSSSRLGPFFSFSSTQVLVMDLLPIYTRRGLDLCLACLSISIQICRNFLWEWRIRFPWFHCPISPQWTSFVLLLSWLGDFDNSFLVPASVPCPFPNIFYGIQFSEHYFELSFGSWPIIHSLDFSLFFALATLCNIHEISSNLLSMLWLAFHHWGISWPDKLLKSMLLMHSRLVYPIWHFRTTIALPRWIW